MRSSATSAGRGSADTSWGIDQQCPQCGAPVCLDETDRLLVCDYCRVRLILAVSGTVRTYLPPRDPSPDGLVFVPYWRLKGQAWSFGVDGIRSSVVDMTRLAARCPGLSPSLGVRPQAMRLRFLTPATPGRLAHAVVRLEEALALRWRSLDELEAEPPYHHILLGDRASLIYQPIRLARGLKDAVLDRPIAQAPPATLDLDPEPLSGEIRFFSTVCPNCGGDLDGERDSLVQICRACRTAWKAGTDSLIPCTSDVLASTFAPDVHLPFWRTQARVEGLPLASYDDLLRHANLPGRGLGTARCDAGLSFWTPAFKIHPEHWARIARTVTLRQPEERLERMTPVGDVVPVTLSSLGIESAVRVLIAAIAGNQGSVLRKIERIEVGDARSELVYVPFQANVHEICHPEMLLAMSRNLLSFGRNL